MGYDYHNGADDLSTSFNHSFYFFQYLDKERGLRFIYGKRGRDVLPFLLKMRQDLQGSPAWSKNYCDYYDEQRADGNYFKTLTSDGVAKDGWFPSIGNAYYFLDKIIQACIKTPYGKWSGD